MRVTDARRLQPGDQIRAGTTLLIYGEDPDGNPPEASPASAWRGKGEIDVNVEHTVASNDESMIMSSPDPRQAAEFQLNIIYELVNLIGSITDKQELFEKVMEVVFDYFDADRGFMLVSEKPRRRARAGGRAKTPRRRAERAARAARERQTRDASAGRSCGTCMRKGMGCCRATR